MAEVIEYPHFSSTSLQVLTYKFLFVVEKMKQLNHNGYIQTFQAINQKLLDIFIEPNHNALNNSTCQKSIGYSSESQYQSIMYSLSLKHKSIHFISSPTICEHR